MNLELTHATRRPRTSRRPAGRTIIVSPRDLEIFKLLDRYRYLPSNFILAFVGGNPIRFKQRLGQLFHEGYLNRPYRQWHTLNARYRPAIYELDEKAREVLVETDSLSKNRVGVGSSFVHEVMVCEVMASFELAARRDVALGFIPWPELVGQAPERTQRALNPFTIPVTVSHDNHSGAFELRPDGRPFALQRAVDGGGKRSLYFPGFEVDRHTEPLGAADLERSSIIKKVLAYREMVASDIYKSHFGFSNMLVPFVTVNAQHMRNMIELVLKITKGKGASYLLFKTIPDLVSVERTIEPYAGIVSEPWLRAGRPAFDIQNELLAN